MNRILILFLLAVMLLQAFSKVLIIVDYQANKEYIMEFLCINRDKPELACEGKCQLSKKLNEREQAEKNANEPNQKQEVQVNLFCHNPLTVQLVMLPKAVKTRFPKYLSGKPVQALYPIFHPPQGIV